MSSTFGDKIKMTIFGESHGPAIGIVLDGLPAGIELDMAAINREMARRAPGKNAFSTARAEKDAVEIQSGFFQGKTTGMALCGLIHNSDAHSKDYSLLKEVMRPSHGDYPGYVKFKGCNDYRGGGSFSGRLTAPLVFAGAIAKQILAQYNITLGAHIAQLGQVEDRAFNYLGESEAVLEKLATETLPTLDSEAASKMAAEILAAAEQKNSVGGIIECMAMGVPVGLGEPYFDSVESKLAHGLFSVPAVKGVEFGKGFALSAMLGSTANDQLTFLADRVQSVTNNNGGIQGGITNGMPLVVRVGIKPTPSIGLPQQTVNIVKKENTLLEITGRHDPCIVQRAVVVIEAVMAWTILDLLLQEKRG